MASPFGNGCEHANQRAVIVRDELRAFARAARGIPHGPRLQFVIRDRGEAHAFFFRHLDALRARGENVGERGHGRTFSNARNPGR